MKKIIGVVALTLSALTPAVANEHAELKKELEIMSSVVQTALKQSPKDSPIRVRSIKSTYLAKQGVVFTLGVSGHHSSVMIDIENIFHNVAKAPLPPITIMSGDKDISFDFSTEWEEFGEQAFEELHETLERTSEQLRDLHEKRRDSQWEKRELERELRKLEFQVRSGPKEDKQTAEAEMKEIEKQIAKLNKKGEEMAAFAKEIESEQKKQNAARVAAKEKATKQFLSGFEAEMGDILCRFGGGLRALPEDEHVTLILQNMSSNHDKRLDRIYVFGVNDIKRCLQNKIDTNELLTLANVYDF